MNPFEELNLQTENLWRSSGQSLEAFPELATKVLREFHYAQSLGDLDRELAKWFLQGRVPEQINLHNSFGQPPITLFNNGKFVIDLYIWLNFDMSLHSHGFRGAFRVLHGSSLHEEFPVATLSTFAPDVHLSKLGTPENTILRAGDVRTIWPGRDLTHRVIHLENPTVTLCIKTINEADLQQWNYFENGLAIQKRSVPETLVKSIYYFQYLSTRDEEQAAQFLFDLLNDMEISLQMNLFEEIAGGALDLSEETAHFILETITARHATEEWLRLYDSANLGHVQKLDFLLGDFPLGRLAAHAVNAKYPKEELQRLTLQLYGRPATTEQKDEALASLTDALLPEQLKSVRKLLF